MKIIRTKKNLFIFLLISLFLSACRKEVDRTPLGAKKLDCLVSGNITLTNHNPNGVDYICDCDVEISSGVYTIEKNVTIEFSNGGGIRVTNSGALSVNGTAAEPIIMRGSSVSQNYWLGISFESNSTNNELNHFQILNAGMRAIGVEVAGGTNIQDAAIAVSGRLKMSNSTISKSAGSGLVVSETGKLFGFSSNTIQQCNNFPVFMYAGQLNNTAFNTCSFSANTKNYIGIYSVSSNAEVAETVNFVETSIPYFGLSTLSFQAPATIASGVHLTMSENSAFIVHPSSSLKINGTAVKPVQISGENAVAGSWRGMLVRSNSTNNVFNYLIISDGGQAELGFGTGITNLAVGELAKAQLTLNNCESIRSAGCQLSHSTADGTIVNNSPNITNVCTY